MQLHIKLVLDRIVTKKSEPVAGDFRTDGKSAIASSTLILFNLKNAPPSNNSQSPQELRVKGCSPRWMP